MKAGCPACGSPEVWEQEIVVAYRTVEAFVEEDGSISVEDLGIAFKERPGPPEDYALDWPRYQCARCGEHFDDFVPLTEEA